MRTSFVERVRWLGAAGLCLAVLVLSGPAPAAACVGVWICPKDVQILPTSGPAWEALLRTSRKQIETPHISDQNDDADVVVLAKALVYARTGDTALRREVIEICRAAIGSERQGTTLALGRNLAGYVIAADIVDLPPPVDGKFRAWLRQVRDERLAGRTLIRTHEKRPNNWGTHAGASRLAIARYLGEEEEVARVANIFKGWLGDRTAYSGFRFGASDWQADPTAPVGINPKGSTRDGNNIDGLLPDDQRRCCDGFKWPPPREPYVYEALQGALAQAVMLDRAGYAEVWTWQNSALLRAFRWLYDVARFPAAGDDTWQPYVVNHFYCTNFPATSPARPGKGLGFTDWTLAPCGSRTDEAP